MRISRRSVLFCCRFLKTCIVIQALFVCGHCNGHTMFFGRFGSFSLFFCSFPTNGRNYIGMLLCIPLFHVKHILFYGVQLDAQYGKYPIGALCLTHA